MELFVMSKCPFASQVEQALAPALRKLGRAVDLRMEFIGDEPQPGELTSMHGDGEVRGDLLYVCTRQYAPERLLDLAVCMDRDLKQIPENFNACAADTGVPAATIRRCAEGEEGRRLLSASFRAAKDRGVRGSPTIYIAGERYQGGRTELDFRRGLCQALGEDGPKTCQDIPEPLAIDLTILTDARCKDCNPDRVQGQLKNMFPGLRPRTVDFGTPEGRALFRVTSAAGAGKLPQFLFGPNVVDDPGFGQIQRFIKDAGPYKLLEIGAKFDPLAEICDNGEDDDANGRVDCADPGCQEKLACRPEQPERLDLFMMSQCPFAAKAVLALREVLPRLQNAVDLRIHFIVDDTPTGFKSLHGQAEVDESLREVCVLDAYPKNFQYLEYFSCRSEDVRSTDWQRCARNGISAAVIDKCVASGRAAKLLRKNLEFAKTLDVGASPTWFVNNRHQATGVTAEAILKAYCEHNPDADGCP